MSVSAIQHPPQAYNPASRLPFSHLVRTNGLAPSIEVTHNPGKGEGPYGQGFTKRVTMANELALREAGKGE